MLKRGWCFIEALVEPKAILASLDTKKLLIIILIVKLGNDEV